MQKICKKCSINFEITNSDLEFYKKISPKFPSPQPSPLQGEGVEQIIFEIPAPTLCPECRQQRRLAFRNERKLYKRKCDATGENIISIYSPDKELKVYSNNFWWSDKWNELDYWVDFDFSKSFSEQFRELQLEVPRLAIINWEWDDNSEYTNHSYYQKNCYLVFEAWYNEDSIYWNTVWNSKKCIDCSFAYNSEQCYQSISINNCNKCFYSQRLKDCYNCYYCMDCQNSKNCFWSRNLINKEYVIYNKQVTKEEFKNFLKNNQKPEEKYLPKKIVKNLNIISSENSIWDDIENAKDSTEIYNCLNVENVKYSSSLTWAKNSYDYDVWWEDAENMYEVHCSWRSYNIMFSNIIWAPSSDIYYSDNLIACKNCFWCISLKNKEYCIFNKQYTKEEYNKLVAKIVEYMKTSWEWWEFFPANLSPFWYNETVAKEYFPLEKEKILEQNFNYSEYEPPFPKVEKIIQAKKLPKNISDIPDDILNWAIECEISKKPFRIIKLELEFYRKHNLPIPKKHPDVRHSERMKLRNPRKLFDRNCDKCGVKMKSTYSSDIEEIVYCEKCYNKEIY